MHVYVNNILGILLDTYLLFDKHYESVQNKAFFVLGFINRNCKDFKNLFALKALCTIL